MLKHLLLFVPHYLLFLHYHYLLLLLLFFQLLHYLEFVFQKISDLLRNGIDINNISLMNLDDEYFPYLKMMEKFYDIKVDYQLQDSLMGTIMGQYFYSLIQARRIDD